MKKFILASIASIAATGAIAGGYVAPVAPAPEVPVVASPIVEASNWQGFYAGLQYGQGSADLEGFGESLDLGDADAYGLHAGYNHAFGKFILGGELDYNKLDFDNADDDGDLTRLRARAGYDMGRFLPYVTLGAARVSTDYQGADLSETGITYGVGAEYLVTEKFSVGLEYTRNDFSDVLEDRVGDGLDLDSDLVQVRASYRF
ncbi:porin family protein [Paracoccus caeni]|uniref:Porin family protein n=1 Tax=Paracoccus caeni TaxID=657651 RepID=A0A934SID5_9RHOB|nr:porin family protein [Paracoccus caeni]MBK4215917.1 porin family protein [Paracoccus caeni]